MKVLSSYNRKKFFLIDHSQFFVDTFSQDNIHSMYGKMYEWVFKNSFTLFWSYSIHKIQNFCWQPDFSLLVIQKRQQKIIHGVRFRKSYDAENFFYLFPYLRINILLLKFFVHLLSSAFFEQLFICQRPSSEVIFQPQMFEHWIDRVGRCTTGWNIFW